MASLARMMACYVGHHLKDFLYVKVELRVDEQINHKVDNNK